MFLFPVSKDITEIRNALAVAGVRELPRDLAAVVDVYERSESLRKLPDLHAHTRDLAASIARGAVDGDDLEKRVEAAADELLRTWVRQELVRASLGSVVEDRVRQEIRKARPELVAAVRPAFSKARDVLMKYAPKLPSVTDPLTDMDAIVHANASDAYLRVREALNVIMTLGPLVGLVPNILWRGQATPNHHRNVADLIRVVDLPLVDALHTCGINGKVMNSPASQARREPIARLVRLAEDEGVERTLVRIARGEFPEDVRIELATPGDDLRRRSIAARNARLTLHQANTSDEVIENVFE